MKIAIISDIHSLKWVKYTKIDILETIVNNINLEYKPDYILNAGDYESTSDKLPTNYFSVPGNHDYYGKKCLLNDSLAVIHLDSETVLIKAVLWTSLDNNNYLTKYVADKYMPDFRRIIDFSPDEQVRIFNNHLDFIKKSSEEFKNKKQVWMTHHAPSSKSVSEKYKHLLHENFCFYSDLEYLIKDKRPLVWIHGHVHHKCDYVIGNTRIICNPLGYPGECYKQYEDYKPVIIEV